MRAAPTLKTGSIKLDFGAHYQTMLNFSAEIGVYLCSRIAMLRNKVMAKCHHGVLNDVGIAPCT